MLTRLLCYLFLVTFLSQKCFAKSKAQFAKMNIISDSITVNEYDTEYVSDVKVVIDNPGTIDYLISIEATIVKEIPASTAGLVAILKKTGDKYIPVGIKLQKNVCELIKTEKLFYPSFTKQGNFPDKCPVLPKAIKMEKYRVPIDDLPPMMPSGNWKVIIQLKLGNKILVDAFWLGQIKY